MNVFPVWSDSILRLVLGAVPVVALGVPLAFMGYKRSPLFTGVGYALAQPVAFDHRHHVQDDGIGCFYCHGDARRSSYAGVPDTATCMGCHSQIWVDSPLLAPVRASYAEGEPIRWRRLHDLPDFVFFDHSAHVHGGVGCETCHGRVDQMAAVHQVVALQMKWCLDCHRSPERYVRPREEITTMGYIPAEPQAELGVRLVREYQLSPPIHCSGCHR